MKTLFTGSKSTGSDARRTRWGVLASSLAAVALLAAPLAIDIGSNGASGLIGSANAAPGGVPGKPVNGGGGGSPQDFGDLIKLYRDASGVPHLTADGCWQPLPSDTCDTTVCTLVGAAQDSAVLVVPVDPATCAVEAACVLCTEEADFGRVNEARSPDEVFASQLEDVVVALAIADCTTLDPAGRSVASTIDDTTLDNLAKTIDSPLQNLAIYRELLLTGTIGVDLPQGADILDTAARGLGAASDKAGEVDVDLVAYLNQIMGLSDAATVTILDPKLCQERKQEVQGVVQFVEECFLDYSLYGYNRDANFVALPAPPYIPETSPTAGFFEYLIQLDDVPTFGIAQGPITTAVFADEPFSDVNIGGFAQAADDTRAVINFMHTWQVPVGSETPVPCVPDDPGAVSYDLSISEQSGLQVPTTYINGTDREFSVTVANAGPDTANGTVTVTATAAAGGPVDGSPWIFCFNGDASLCPVDADQTAPALAAGSTQSFLVQPFVIDLGQSTTITWEATVVADPPGTDPNPANNTVFETTNVRNNTGGGGGGGGNGGQGGNPN